MGNAILIPVIAVFLGAFIFLLQKFLSIRKKFSLVSVEKNNYETICHEANDAMLVIDIVDGKIHKANSALAAMLGYSVERLEHISLFDLHPKDMLHRSSEVIADVWEKGGMVYQDLPFVKAGGELLAVECSAKVMQYAERPSVLIYARDITERLRMENEIREKNKLIEEKNKDILDSIRYAKRLQQAILPPVDLIKNVLPEIFLLYKPKDIVAGDFYWFHSSTDLKYVLLAVCDCTGHGVPGAMVSVVCSNALNRAVKEFGLSDTGKILDKVTDLVLETFEKSGEQIKDGMDISLLKIEFDTNSGSIRNPVRVEWSGANSPLWYAAHLVDGGQSGVELAEIKADKQPIGKSDYRKPFTTHKIETAKGSALHSSSPMGLSFYLFTDGYADQFGGPKGKKFKYSQLKKNLLSVQDKTMEEQKEILNTTFDNWRGNLEQVDDVCIIGIKV